MLRNGTHEGYELAVKHPHEELENVPLSFYSSLKTHSLLITLTFVKWSLITSNAVINSQIVVFVFSWET